MIFHEQKYDKIYTTIADEMAHFMIPRVYEDFWDEKGMALDDLLPIMNYYLPGTQLYM